MADAQQTGTPASATPVTTFTISDTVRQQLPDIVDLILRSESMNDSERQYWFDILPVMNPEQVQNLRTILTNERVQLAAIEAKYASTNAPTIADIAKIGDARKSSREQLKSQETQAQVTEEAAEQELLQKMQGI